MRAGNAAHIEANELFTRFASGERFELWGKYWTHRAVGRFLHPVGLVVVNPSEEHLSLVVRATGPWFWLVQYDKARTGYRSVGTITTAEVAEQSRRKVELLGHRPRLDQWDYYQGVVSWLGFTTDYQAEAELVAMDVSRRAYDQSGQRRHADLPIADDIQASVLAFLRHRITNYDLFLRLEADVNGECDDAARSREYEIAMGEVYQYLAERRGDPRVAAYLACASPAAA